MRVLLDTQVVAENAPSIAEGLAAARTAAEQRGRVVVEALIDGEPLSDADLGSPPTSPSHARELRFTTADPGELVGSTLSGVAETIGDLKDDQTAAAELLTLGKMTEAMDRLQNALKAWDAVRQAVVDGATLMGLSVETLAYVQGGGRRLLGDDVRGLAVALAEVKRAFGAQDWAALADVVGYDLQEQADRWNVALRAISEQVRSATPATLPQTPAAR